MHTTYKLNGHITGCVCLPCLAENANMTLDEYRAWVREQRKRPSRPVRELPAEPTDTERNEQQRPMAYPPRTDGPKKPDAEYLAEAALILARFDRKLEVSDVSGVYVLHKAATIWLRSYEGTFEFLLDLKAKKPKRLSDGMVKAVLNCWRAESYNAERARKATFAKQASVKATNDDAPDLSGLIEHTYRRAGSVPTVHFAYQPDDGQAQFYRLDFPEDGKWAGWIFVKAQYSDEYERAGSQRPGARYAGQRTAAMRAILADPDAAMLLYGQLIERCAKCNRVLTNRESRMYGIGPECRKAA